MVDGEMSCEFCDKVYIRKGSLQKHIASKHQVERGQGEVDGQLFGRIDIPEDIDEFPGPDDETMREAGEAAELVEAEAADTEIEQQLNLNCNNCTNGTSIEKRLTLKIRALEKNKKMSTKEKKGPEK